MAVFYFRNAIPFVEEFEACGSCGWLEFPDLFIWIVIMLGAVI